MDIQILKEMKNMSNAAEEAKKLSHLFLDYKMIQTLCNTVCYFLKKLTVQLPHNPRNLLMSICTHRNEDLCPLKRLSIDINSSLFEIAKTWKDAL